MLACMVVPGKPVNSAGHHHRKSRNSSTIDSRLKLDLSVEGSVATGTWTERTSPTGYYKGAVYHGALQLVVDPMGRRMQGRWLGFGRDFQVNTGDWALTWVDGSLSRSTLRQYHFKA
jgi:hypothetical protein